MSPLWNKPGLRAYLRPDGVHLVQLSRGRRPSLQDKAAFSWAHGDWRNGLATLEPWLAAHAGMAIEFVLSSSLCRFITLPRDQTLTEQTARLALARLLFERHYGEDPALFEFALSPLHFGATQQAVAVSAEFIKSVQSLPVRQGCQLRGITPLLSCIWDRYERRLPGTNGTLALLEENRLTCAHYERRQVVAVQIRPGSAIASLLAEADADNPIQLLALQQPSLPLHVHRIELPLLEGYSPESDGNYAPALWGAL